MSAGYCAYLLPYSPVQCSNLLMASSPAAVDGYIQHLPTDKLSLTELHREHHRLTQLRAYLPVASVERVAAVVRLQQVHRERRLRIAQIALRLSLSLV